VTTKLSNVEIGPEAQESGGDSGAQMTLVRLRPRDRVTQDVAYLGFEASPATSGTATQLLLHALLEIADDELSHLRSLLRRDDITISSTPSGGGEGRKAVTLKQSVLAVRIAEGDRLPPFP
jgi:hypothetical protein